MFMSRKCQGSDGVILRPGDFFEANMMNSVFSELRNDGCNATQNLITFSWDMCHLLFPDQTIFDFPTSIINHFHNKIVSAQRNIAYKFYTVYPQTAAFSEGNLCLCIENVICVSDSFFFISNHSVGIYYSSI